MFPNSSLFFTLFFVFASVALAQQRDKRDIHVGQFVRGIAYLANLTKEEKAEYMSISTAKDLTIKQQEEKRMAFAKTHGFEAALVDDEKVKESNKELVIKQRPEIIKYLAEANEQLVKIYSNKDQTVADQNKAVDELKKKYPNAVPTLFYMSRLLTGKRGMKKN